MSGPEGSSTKREVPGAAGLPEFLVFTVYKKALALCQSFFVYFIESYKKAELLVETLLFIFSLVIQMITFAEVMLPSSREPGR